MKCTKKSCKKIGLSLNKLIEKGLASETFVKDEKLFKAIDPERLKK